MAATDKLRPIARRALAAQSDERLVRLIREGHAPAFEEAVRRYRGPLVAFAGAIVSPDRAEDVVQAALQKAHVALRADDREINLRPWLFAIVRNGALNLIRDDPTWEEIDPNVAGAPQPAAVAEQNEDLQRLVVAICALPAAQREALVRREIEGEGHAEIAATLGTSATAVRGLIFRARTALRDGFGALIPLPVLRLLMTEGAAAGGGAAVGGLALGTGGKAGVVVTTAALALGGGLVAEREDRGERIAEASPVERESGADDRSGSAGESGAAGLAAAGPGAEGGDDSSGPGGNSGPGGGDDSGGDDRDEDENEGEGSTSDGPGDSSGPGDGADDGDDDGDDDGSSSGPGSGGDDGTGSSGPGPGEPEIEEDHSGPGGGGSDDPPEIDTDNSGPGGGGGELEEIEEELEEPTESDNSGPGGGGSSGSGSSGTGG